MTNINPKLRVSLYIVVAAAGAVLVTYGIVEQEVVDSILPMVAGVLAVAGGGVAAANTDTKKINPVADEQEEPVKPASSVPDVTPSVSGLPVWDQPSSIPDEGYAGRHRLGG